MTHFIITFFIAVTVILLLSSVSASKLQTLRSSSSSSIPSWFTPPLYKQCDPKWGNEKMGVPGQPDRYGTICDQGCAMTSLTMVLAGLGAKMDGSLINPASFNKWLRENNGYLCLGGDCANLKLDAVHNLSNQVRFIGEVEKPSFSTISSYLSSPYSSHVFVIGHVRNKTHFVLLMQPQGTDGFQVHDPFFNTSSYSYGDISDVLLYKYNAYPLYKQCGNASYSQDQMGDVVPGKGQYNKHHFTICDVGCLMSSTTSAIAGSGIRIPGYGLANPGTMNHFLGQASIMGYVQGTADLEESKVPKVSPSRIRWPSDGMHVHNDVSVAQIRAWLLQSPPRIVVANVLQGGHFTLVVAVGADGETLYINDSGFNRLWYNYTCTSKSDMRCVVGWRIFDMIPVV